MMKKNFYQIETIILAAGFGKRTEGILRNLPKTLIITSDGKTILEHTLKDLIKNCGLNKITIISNAKYSRIIKSEIKDKFPDVSINVLNDGVKTAEERLGALGDLLLAFKKLKSQASDFLVLPSDSAYWQSFSLSDFLDFALKQKNCFVTVVRNVKDKKIIQNRFGCAVLDGKNQIVKFIEKPKKPLSTFAAVPFYLYRKDHQKLLKEYIKQGGDPDSPGNIIPFFLKKGVKIKAYIVNEKIIDAGTPQDIEKAEKY